MIDAGKLISWFYYMYDNGWGYIWGKSGQMWTEKAQKAATNEMAIKYGSKWIGHYVTDCSGAFVYAFKKEGGSIYHGSNTIWKKYCSSQGTLKKGKREDGEVLKPGTALFLLRDGNRHHIGLYVGNDMVIEAKGTQYGVTISRTDHWDEWGELKDVDYTNAFDAIPKIDPSQTRRMLRTGCYGADVKDLQHALNVWNSGVKAIDEDGAFGPKTKLMVEMFQTDNGLKADGIVGPQTWKALEPYLNPGEGVKNPVKIAVVCLPVEDGHDEKELKQLLNDWMIECPLPVKEWKFE